jgi:acyl carrier protein
MVSKEQIVKVIESTGVVSDMSKFDTARTFKENGIDSLDVFTLYLAVEEQLGVSFSEEESTRIKTVDEMVAFLNGR